MRKEDLVEDNGFFAENDRILLRQTCEEDEENHMKLVVDVSAIQAAYKMKRFYDAIWNEIFQPDFLCLTILDKKTSGYLGYINIRYLSNDIPELGIDIVKNYRREGFGYNAVRLVTEQMKRKAGCRTFLVRINANNTASLRLFHKFSLSEIVSEENDYTTTTKSLHEVQDPSEFQEFKEQIPEKRERKSQRYIINYHLKV